MKKVFTTIATWIKSLFAKKKHAEQTKREMSIEEKKQVVSEFNKSVEELKKIDLTIEKELSEEDHKQVLKVTVRNKKPFKYDKSKNVEFSTPMGIILLTKKQSLFLNMIHSNQDKNNGINGNDVCEMFMKEKFKDSDKKLNEKNCKYDYHKSTFKYLLKQGLIERVSRGHYKTTY